MFQSLFGLAPESRLQMKTGLQGQVSDHAFWGCLITQDIDWRS